MIVSFKDIFKMTGILIVSFCAVFVCALFLNFYLDVLGIEDMITTETTEHSIHILSFSDVRSESILSLL